LAAVSETCVSFPVVEITTSRSPRARMWLTTPLLRFTSVVWRLAQVCKLPLALSVSQNPLGGVLRYQAIPSLHRRIAPVWLWLAEWRRFPRLSPVPSSSSINLTVPQARAGQLATMLCLHSRPVAGRLAQVCKLPLTLTVRQNPLGGILRGQDPHRGQS